MIPTEPNEKSPDKVCEQSRIMESLFSPVIKESRLWEIESMLNKGYESSIYNIIK